MQQVGWCQQVIAYPLRDLSVGSLSAFLPLTSFYDSANGFFIPYDRMKYSVGENAEMQLNAEGGIDVYIAAEAPEGVPLENWLPINRKDEDIDVILRVYVPDLEAIDAWSPPAAQRLGE